MSHPATRSRVDVLVVEDDRENGALLLDVFEAAGFSARLATNGDDALARLAHPEGLPRVIVLDLQLPGLDGWDLISVIRARPDTASLPIIVVSGFAPGEAQDYGGITCFSKPVDLQALVRSVKRHVLRSAPPESPRRAAG